MSNYNFEAKVSSEKNKLPKSQNDSDNNDEPKVNIFRRESNIRFGSGLPMAEKVDEEISKSDESDDEWVDIAPKKPTPFEVKQEAINIASRITEHREELYPESQFKELMRSIYNLELFTTQLLTNFKMCYKKVIGKENDPMAPLLQDLKEISRTDEHNLDNSEKLKQRYKIFQRSKQDLARYIDTLLNDQIVQIKKAIEDKKEELGNAILNNDLTSFKDKSTAVSQYRDARDKLLAFEESVKKFSDWVSNDLKFDTLRRMCDQSEQ